MGVSLPTGGLPVPRPTQMLAAAPRTCSKLHQSRGNNPGQD